MKFEQLNKWIFINVILDIYYNLIIIYSIEESVKKIRD